MAERWMRCPDCSGSGRDRRGDCATCAGDGVVPTWLVDPAVVGDEAARSWLTRRRR